MKQEEKKSIPVDRALVKEMQVEKALTGKQIYRLIAEAWGLYKRMKNEPRLPFDVGDVEAFRRATARMQPGEVISIAGSTLQIKADDAVPGRFVVSLLDDAQFPEAEHLDRLLWILRNGTEGDREWILGNLKNFEEAIRSRQARPFRKRAGK